MAKASVDTGVEVQGEALPLYIYGRYGPEGVSFSHPAFFLSQPLGWVRPHPTSQHPHLLMSLAGFISRAEVEGYRRNPKGVDNRVIIQWDETELSGVS